MAKAPGLKIAARRRLSLHKRRLAALHRKYDGSFEHVMGVADIYADMIAIQKMIARWDERSDRWAA